MPQRPFVIAGSLLDNVLLGRALDRARLREVLQASALDLVRVRVRVRASPNPNPNPNQVERTRLQHLAQPRPVEGAPEQHVVQQGARDHKGALRHRRRLRLGRLR